MTAPTNLRITGPGFEKIAEDLRKLADREVLAGFAEDGEGVEERKDDAGETLDNGKAVLGGKSEITNAALAYIHDNGLPEQNIPKRAFMAPAMEEARERIADKLGQTLRAVLRAGGEEKLDKGLHQVGLIAQAAIREKINDGPPPPLADATLRERARRGRKGAGIELLSRSMGIAPSSDFAKPLVDTAQMRNAATYVIRKRSDRR